MSRVVRTNELSSRAELRSPHFVIPTGGVPFLHAGVEGPAVVWSGKVERTTSGEPEPFARNEILGRDDNSEDVPFAGMTISKPPDCPASLIPPAASNH